MWKQTMGRTVILGLILYALSSYQAPALRASNPMLGYVAYEPGGDYNRCVPDAGNVLQRLNARGELIGFQYSSAGYTALDGKNWHIQGIARLPFYAWDTLLRGQFFAATFSHPRGTGVDYSSHLGMAQMGFKGGKEGKLLGSNRAYNDNWNSDIAEWKVTPNPYDSFFSVAGTPKFKIDENENHPGGISTLGWHLVVPLQKYDAGGHGFLGLKGGTPDDSNPYVKIYDLWDPGWPVLRSTFLTSGRGTDNRAAAITKLDNGKFLLAVMKSDPNRVEFYVSTGTDLDAPDVFGADDREPDKRWDHDLPDGWENINFITDCSGDLFLLGFRGGSDDYIDMYKIDLFEDGFSPDLFYDIETEKWGSKHMYCSDNSNVDQCDMKAAAGSYIDPNGQVVIYSVNYANDGGAYVYAIGKPWVFGSNSNLGEITSYVYGNGNPWCAENGPCSSYPPYSNYLRGVEFHERHGNNGPGTACPTLADAWVEFYEHPDFNNYGDNAGQYYRIDYTERDAKNGKNMGANYFNDKASSMRWCIPAGHSFKFYRDNWSGSYQYLNGTGDVRSIQNLNGSNYAYGGGSTNDSITSYYFEENHVDSLGWYGDYDYGD